MTENTKVEQFKFFCSSPDCEACESCCHRELTEIEYQELHYMEVKDEV